MRQPSQQPEGTGNEKAGIGRRAFLRRAGLAAAVVGGIEAVGMTSAMAATSRKYSAAKAGKPDPNVGPRCNPGSCTITWTCTPGQCGSACKSPMWCYHYVRSGSCSGSGKQCAWSNCGTHVQCL
jgi:hypothetical protein